MLLFNLETAIAPHAPPGAVVRSNDKNLNLLEEWAACRRPEQAVEPVHLPLAVICRDL